MAVKYNINDLSGKFNLNFKQFNGTNLRMRNNHTTSVSANYNIRNIGDQPIEMVAFGVFEFKNSEVENKYNEWIKNNSQYALNDDELERLSQCDDVDAADTILNSVIARYWDSGAIEGVEASNFHEIYGFSYEEIFKLMSCASDEEFQQKFYEIFDSNYEWHMKCYLNSLVNSNQSLYLCLEEKNAILSMGNYAKGYKLFCDILNDKVKINSRGEIVLDTVKVNSSSSKDAIKAVIFTEPGELNKHPFIIEYESEPLLHSEKIAKLWDEGKLYGEKALNLHEIYGFTYGEIYELLLYLSSETPRTDNDINKFIANIFDEQFDLRLKYFLDYYEKNGVFFCKEEKDAIYNTGNFAAATDMIDKILKDEITISNSDGDTTHSEKVIIKSMLNANGMDFDSLSSALNYYNAKTEIAYEIENGMKKDYPFLTMQNIYFFINSLTLYNDFANPEEARQYYENYFKQCNFGYVVRVANYDDNGNLYFEYDWVAGDYVDFGSNEFVVAELSYYDVWKDDLEFQNFLDKLGSGVFANADEMTKFIQDNMNGNLSCTGYIYNYYIGLNDTYQDYANERDWLINFSIDGRSKFAFETVLLPDFSEYSEFTEESCDKTYELLSIKISSSNTLKDCDKETMMAILYLYLNGDNSVSWNGFGVRYSDPNSFQSYKVTNDDNLLEEYMVWASYMSTFDINAFNYYYNKEGYESAFNYLNSLSSYMDSVYVNRTIVEETRDALEYPVGASIASVFYRPFNGMRVMLYSLDCLVSGEEMRQTYTHDSVGTVRGVIANNIAMEYGEGWSFVYSTGMSIADTTLQMIVGAGLSPVTGGMSFAGQFAVNAAVSFTLMGTSTYAATLDDALSRGLSDSNAILLAATACVIETAAESVSMTKLFRVEGIGNTVISKTLSLTDDMADGLLKSVTQRTISICGNVLLQAITEADEEFITEVLNHVADQCISGDLSAYNLSIASKIESGMSEDQARAEANNEFKNQLWQSWIGGFASGCFFGFIKGVTSDINVDVNINLKEEIINEFSFLSGFRDNAQIIAKYVLDEFTIQSFNIEKKNLRNAIRMDLKNGNFESIINRILLDENTASNVKVNSATAVVISLENHKLINGDIKNKLLNIINNYNSNISINSDNLSNHKKIGIQFFAQPATDIKITQSNDLSNLSQITDVNVLRAGLKNGTITNVQLQTVFHDLIGDTLFSWVPNAESAANLYINLLDACNNAKIGISEVKSSIGLMEAMVKYYEDASNLELETDTDVFNTYRTHGIVHIFDVLTQSINSFAAFKQIGIENLSYRTIMLSAIMHDTGMSGGKQIKITIDDNKNLVINTVDIASNGKTYRESHSFNSAVNILNEYEALSAKFKPIEIAEAALLTFAHSKSNSGLNPLSNNNTAWSFAIQALAKATEGSSFNIIDVLVQNGALLSRDMTVSAKPIQVKTPDGKPEGSIGVFSIDESWVKRMSYEALAVRMGDALTNNDNAGQNQYRVNIDTSKTDYRSQLSIGDVLAQKGIDPSLSMSEKLELLVKLLGEKDKSKKLDFAALGIEESHALSYLVGTEVYMKSQPFVLGENNQTYGLRIDSEQNVEVVVSVKHSEAIPFCTLFAVDERMGELNSKGEGIFSHTDPNQLRMVIEIDSTTSEDVKALYRSYAEFYNSKPDSVKVEIREVNKLAQITDPKVLRAGLENGTITNGQIETLFANLFGDEFKNLNMSTETVVNLYFHLLTYCNNLGINIVDFKNSGPLFNQIVDIVYGLEHLNEDLFEITETIKNIKGKNKKITNIKILDSELESKISKLCQELNLKHGLMLDLGALYETLVSLNPSNLTNKSFLISKFKDLVLNFSCIRFNIIKNSKNITDVVCKLGFLLNDISFINSDGSINMDKVNLMINSRDNFETRSIYKYNEYLISQSIFAKLTAGESLFAVASYASTARNSVRVVNQMIMSDDIDPGLKQGTNIWNTNFKTSFLNKLFSKSSDLRTHFVEFMKNMGVAVEVKVGEDAFTSLDKQISKNISDNLDLIEKYYYTLVDAKGASLDTNLVSDLEVENAWYAVLAGSVSANPGVDGSLGLQIFQNEYVFSKAKLIIKGCDLKTIEEIIKLARSNKLDINGDGPIKIYEYLLKNNFTIDLPEVKQFAIELKTSS